MALHEADAIREAIASNRGAIERTAAAAACGALAVVRGERARSDAYFEGGLPPRLIEGCLAIESRSALSFPDVQDAVGDALPWADVHMTLRDAVRAQDREAAVETAARARANAAAAPVAMRRRAEATRRAAALGAAEAQLQRLQDDAVAHMQQRIVRAYASVVEEAVTTLVPRQ